ncbi:MAG TPA: glycosyltransferase family 4 protein [Rhodocyclaceae bacterium]|nr:glycosyltransferase family 4 protein [Rhodocyclaceae bacterium]
MKILYPFPEPLPMAKARTIQVVRTVSALAGEGVEVVLAYVPVPGIDDIFGRYGLTGPPGVQLVPLSRGLPAPLRGLGVHSNRLFFWRLSAMLRRMESDGRVPDAVLVRHLKLAHALLSARPEMPLIYEAHELFADGARAEKAASLAAMERQVLTGASAVVAITGGLAERLQQRYGSTRPMSVIPSATDLPAALPDKDWPNARRHVAYAGNLYPWKGGQDLVASAAFLPGYQLTMVGGDARRIGELQASVAPGGAEVRFLGHVDHAEALAQLAHTCIAVLPNRAGSVSDFTSPLKLFEYMAYGCAIVASDLPVFREVLGSDEAAWFAPGDARALAEAIRGLAEDPQRACNMGDRLRRKAADYTWQARARRLIEVMATVAGDARGHGPGRLGGQDH